jgi:hypothetical protein
VGTGFTHIAQPNGGSGYVSDLLEIRAGALRLTTGPGIQWLRANSLVNGLGVPVPAAEVFTADTTLLDPPLGTRRYEQAGLWIGTDQDNYAKLVYSSPPSRQRLEFSVELNGGQAAFHRAAPPVARPGSLRLLLRRDTRAGRLGAWYSIDGGPLSEFGSLKVPAGFATSHAANGLGSYAGIFGTHRRASNSLVYRFADFAVLCHAGCPAPDPGDPGPGNPGDSDPGPGTVDLGTVDAPRSGGPGSHPGDDGEPGQHGETPFSARVTSPRRASLTSLRRGIRVRVRCSAACRARSQIGPIRGRSRPPAATQLTVRLVSSPRAARALRRQARASGQRRIRLRLRTVVVGPRGQRVRDTRRVVVTL